MIGWRARIGHVAPSRGDMLVYEFYKILPDGFMLLNTTGTIRRLVDDHLDRQLERIEEASVVSLTLLYFWRLWSRCVPRMLSRRILEGFRCDFRCTV